jgi:hypothetical protein
VAEQLALEQRLGHRRAVDRDELRILAARAIVDRARDDLLAGAALAGDEHGCIGDRDLIDQRIDLMHRGRRADHVAAAARRCDDLAQPLDLAAQRAVLGGAADRDRERFDLDRLGHEVVRTRADRADRGLEAAKRGQHDDRQIGPVGDDVLAQLEAGHALHVEIGDDDVDIVLGQRRDRVRAAAERHDVEAALLEAELDEIDHLALVVDDKHFRHEVPAGRYTVNVEPLPGVETTSIHPPCSRTMPHVTLSPRPVPSPTSFVVKNGSKIRSRVASSIPVPVSWTSIAIHVCIAPPTYGGGS